MRSMTTKALAAAILSVSMYGCSSSPEMGNEEMLPPDQATTGNEVAAAPAPAPASADAPPAPAAPAPAPAAPPPVATATPAPAPAAPPPAAAPAAPAGGVEQAQAELTAAQQAVSASDAQVQQATTAHASAKTQLD